MVELFLGVSSILATVTFVWRTLLLSSLDSYFTYHPILMSLSFLILIPQGVLLLVGGKSLVGSVGSLCTDMKRSTKVGIHFGLQLTAVLFYMLGFITIFCHKSSIGSSHLMTWHSILGVTTITFGTVFQIFGVLLYFSKLKVFAESRLDCKPLLVKKVHRITSLVVFNLGIVTILLALSSTWFSKEENWPWYLTSGLRESLTFIPYDHRASWNVPKTAHLSVSISSPASVLKFIHHPSLGLPFRFLSLWYCASHVFCRV
eukprot:TRINITY_DN193_c0_g4_i21.p1 TRINITY_DN193_c0_g4~~TRINITY_DN193_c0_g4_i21.p1  ORF type:complete len:293 (+),score=39.38 TRINITY_DN193_c0_g4_i21:104-880(+)